MSREEDIEPMKDPEEPESVQAFRVYSSGSSFDISLKSKIIFWSMLAGSMAVGTFLFLFFLTLFIYLFLPLTAVLLIYQLFLRFKK